MSNSTFANQLFANPAEALTGFELTPEETAKLNSLSRLEFDTFAAASPEERKSFGLMNHNQNALHIRKSLI
jgi:hypothetical protein